MEYTCNIDVEICEIKKKQGIIFETLKKKPKLSDFFEND